VKAFVTSASMLQVTVLLLIALTTWLALLLFAVALCRGAASADEKAIAASAKRLLPGPPLHAAARPHTVAVPHALAARAPHGTPRRYHAPSRARRGSKHTPRVI